MLADFKAKASAAGHPEWTSPPTDAGSYNSTPSQTQFFTNGFSSAYGKFFLKWYEQILLDHAQRVMNVATTVFTKPALAMKIAGIHWWYGTVNHAAECTAGYYNTNNNNAYLDFEDDFIQFDFVFDFTCLEMTD